MATVAPKGVCAMHINGVPIAALGFTNSGRTSLTSRLGESHQTETSLKAIYIRLEGMREDWVEQEGGGTIFNDVGKPRDQMWDLDFRRFTPRPVIIMAE